MTSKNKAPPPAGDNRRRDRDVIAGEIHHLERNNGFAIGKLLAEAYDGPNGDHGKWMDWLDEFDFSYSSAENYRLAHNLSTKFPTVVNLKVPATVIYDLADDYLEKEDDDGNFILRNGDLLEAILQDLDKEAKSAKSAKRPLRVADCNRIIAAQLRSRLEKLFGALPAWLDKAMLDALDALSRRADTDLLQKVVAKLNKAKSPHSLQQVINIINRAAKQGEDQQDENEQNEGEQGEPPATPDSMLPPKPSTKPTTRETDQAAAVAANAARSDIGADSKGENARLAVDVEALQHAKRVLEGRCLALESEIEELKESREQHAKRVYELEGCLAQESEIEGLIEALAKMLRGKGKAERIKVLQMLAKQVNINPADATLKEIVEAAAENKAA